MNKRTSLKRLLSVLIVCVTALALAACGNSTTTSSGTDYSDELAKDSANLIEGKLYWMTYKVPETWSLRSDGNSTSEKTYDIPLGGYVGVATVAGQNFPDDLDSYVKNTVLASSDTSTFENITRGTQEQAVTYTTDWHRNSDGTKYQGKMYLIFSGHGMYVYSVLLLGDAYPTYEKLVDELIASAQLSETAAPLGEEGSTSSSSTTTNSSSSSSSTSTKSTTDSGSNSSSSSSSSATTSQKKALSRAKSYLKSNNFSYSGLIDQLEYEGYSTEDATYGADNCGADWNAQALGKAKSYLKHSAFCYTGLIEQLEYEGFDEDQASYGADNCGADWMEQAEKKAAQYMKHNSYSRSRLIEQLEYEGFTSEQAEHGADSQDL